MVTVPNTLKDYKLQTTNYNLNFVGVNFPDIEDELEQQYQHVMMRKKANNEKVSAANSKSSSSDDEGTWDTQKKFKKVR